MKMKHNNKITKVVSLCLWMPIIFAVIMLIAGILVIDINRNISYAMVIAGAAYVAISVLYYEYLEKIITTEITNAGFHQSKVYNNMLTDLPIPYVLTDAEGMVLWYNDLFDNMVKGRISRKNISQIFNGLNKKVLPPLSGNKVLDIDYEDKSYRVECRSVLNTYEEEGDEVESVAAEEPGAESYLRVFYFYDITKLKAYQNHAEKERLVTGLIYIDNYEEVLDSMEEVRQSMLPALVERKIVRYLQPMEAIVKRFERDKFIFLIQEKFLDKLLEDKFSLLDDVRAINIGNELAMTLSISIGMNADTYSGTYESARAAMDMALGRGGDQAVVKNGDNISYYGGKTQKVEKNTRVKARVKAHALHEAMLAHDIVLIMGHKIPDADCIGAALGIYRLAKTFGKKAYLVMDQYCPAIEPIVSRLPKPNVDEEDIFLAPEEVTLRKDNSALLVVVDVNVPAMTEVPALLKTAKSVVVLDHHRQSAETIKGAILSYVEPYASSSCEMVAEILQYISTKPKLKPIEADALYSGILVDTDNFVVKAGVRTFEAAAYLRRMGADVTRVRKMFREDREHYMIRNNIINSAEIYMDEFAIAEFEPNGISGATVVGAKAANELLNIQDIRGSFVLTQFLDYIYISARSIDDLNVQVIMEKMGGGGHLTVAAAQIRDKSMAEVLQDLKQILANMKEEGDI